MPGSSIAESLKIQGGELQDWKLGFSQKFHFSLKSSILLSQSHHIRSKKIFTQKSDRYEVPFRATVLIISYGHILIYSCDSLSPIKVHFQM